MWGVGLFFDGSAHHLRRTSVTTSTPRESVAKNPSNLRFEGLFAFGRMFIRLSEKSRSEGCFWAFYTLDFAKTLGFSELAFKNALESLCQYPRNLRPLFFNNPFGQ